MKIARDVLGHPLFDFGRIIAVDGNRTLGCIIFMIGEHAHHQFVVSDNKLYKRIEVYYPIDTPLEEAKKRFWSEVI